MTTQAIQPSVYPQLSAEFKQRRTLNWLAVGLLYATVRRRFTAPASRR